MKLVAGPKTLGGMVETQMKRKEATRMLKQWKKERQQQQQTRKLRVTTA